MAQLIYIGVLAAMDTFEGNDTNENPGAVQGTYDETVMRTVDVAISENTDPGVAYNDDFGKTPDTFTYDLGTGPITSGLDGEARFAAEVIRAGQTISEPVEISVYQLQNGATFVRLPDGYKINQLTIQSMVSDGYDAIYTDSASTSTVVCFVEGTRLDTPLGPRRIETLMVGDQVLTEDRGAHPVIWCARWTVRATEKMAPVRIGAGALGQGLPSAPLEVSRQHRIYLVSPIAQRMFGATGALVAAHRLTALPDIRIGALGGKVGYVHIACQHHELIKANGVLAETLLTGPVACRVIDPTQLPAQIPRLNDKPVRPLISAQKQRRFVLRYCARAERHGTKTRDLSASISAPPIRFDPAHPVPLA